MLDEYTSRTIDKLVEMVLKEARLNEPPIRIEDLLSHLEIDRDFYNLRLLKNGLFASLIFHGPKRDITFQKP
jgi:hypothetical protein